MRSVLEQTEPAFSSVVPLERPRKAKQPNGVQPIAYLQHTLLCSAPYHAYIWAPGHKQRSDTRLQLHTIAMARGTLIPDYYVPHQTTEEDIEISSIIWGLSLGCTLYTFFTAGKQTIKSWRRAKTLTLYIALVWLEWASSTIMGVISWCFLKGVIQPSLEYFLAISMLASIPRRRIFD